MTRKKAEETKTAKNGAKTNAGAKKTPSKGKQSSEEKKPSQAKSGARGSGSSKTTKASTAGTSRAKATGTSKADTKGTAKPKASEESLSGAAVKQVIFSLEAGTPIYVKTADICNATGKTNQWIGQLTSQGVISKTKTSHGQLYELFETVRSYIAMMESRAKRRDETSAAAELRKKQADADYKEAKAEMADMETKEFQGKLHRTEDVQAMTADLLYFIRGSLTALAGRCANDCAASNEPAEIQKIIEKEVFVILEGLTEFKFSRKRYEELVRKRRKKELDVDYFADVDDE